jgi:tryptophan synthase alpha subunit
MLDDGTIQGNLLLDLEGKPLGTAPGRMPDIVYYYKDFVLVVEVTLATGARQYEAEGEPVSRHLAQVRKSLRQQNDNRPVYGLLISDNYNSLLTTIRIPVS